MRYTRTRDFWIILVLFAILIAFQFAEQFGITSRIDFRSSLTFDRILLLIPVIYAAWIYGLKGGLIATAIAFFLSLPQAVFITPEYPDSLIEICGVAITGILISFLLWPQQKELTIANKTKSDLESARRQIQQNLDKLAQSEKRLAMLNSISTTLFSSLESESVFQKAVHLVAELMAADVSLLFTLDPESQELKLVAHEGVSAEFVAVFGKLKLGQGVYGEAAGNGNPMITGNSLTDSDTASDLGVQLIVPIKLKEQVSGVVCVASHRSRHFTSEDTELISTVGTQIAVAIENARLYGEQNQITKRLAESEGKYRRLFDFASDAIWANDLNGKITAANRASAELMGDKIEEMIGSDVRRFLPPEGLETARFVRKSLLAGKTIPQPYEQHLIRKDKSEVILMVSTSLVRHEDEPPVFEHVARDVTKERRMQDNLRYYVQQITRSQEEERNRIARELHDDTVQALYVLNRSIDNYLRSSKETPAEIAAFLKNMSEKLREVLQGVRRFSQELRPPMLDDLGLISALRWLASDMERRCKVTAHVEISGTERRLAPYVELAIFRIIQEAMRNVEKHAAASKVDVTLKFEVGKISITVTDNGKGFKLSGELVELPREGRLGLMGMEKRARLLGGSLNITSELNNGTRVSIELPV